MTLWKVFVQGKFEDVVAAEYMSSDDVLRKLNYPMYFELLELPIPEGNVAVLNTLQNDDMIAPCQAGGWNVTNIDAILLAKNLNDFNGIRLLGRKALRIIQYNGYGRTETLREREFAWGYAVGFRDMAEYIMALLPASEVIKQSLRLSVPVYPEIAVRELVANALIHQDFNVTGAGTMVEIFDNRIEITNPGYPLVPPERFVDYPPRSRNEKMAGLMRRFQICKELGSGIDKVAAQVEIFQLPAPLFETRGILP